MYQSKTFVDRVCGLMGDDKAVPGVASPIFDIDDLAIEKSVGISPPRIEVDR